MFCLIKPYLYCDYTSPIDYDQNDVVFDLIRQDIEAYISYVRYNFAHRKINLYILLNQLKNDIILIVSNFCKNKCDIHETHLNKKLKHT